MAKRCDLTTYDWMRLRDFELRARGEDPADRLRTTGHARCLPEPYLTTIGTWGGCERDELVNDAAPHTATVPVSVSAFRRFKARHHLLSGRQFARVHGPQPWARAQVCFFAYDDAQQAFGNYGAYGPIGVACDYAHTTRLCRGRSLGLLTVEVVLWTRVFDAMLAHHGISVIDWLGFDDDTKSIVWSLGSDQGSWTVDAFLHGPVVRTLHEQNCAITSSTGLQQRAPHERDREDRRMVTTWIGAS